MICDAALCAVLLRAEPGFVAGVMGRERLGDVGATRGEGADMRAPALEKKKLQIQKWDAFDNNPDPLSGQCPRRRDARKLTSLH